MEVLTLIQNITENRLKHARGPVHFTPIPLPRYVHDILLVKIEQQDQSTKVELQKDLWSVGKSPKTS